MSYVFMWDRERCEDVMYALRFRAGSAILQTTSDSLRAAADDLERALAEPITGARFTHRGAE